VVVQAVGGGRRGRRSGSWLSIAALNLLGGGLARAFGWLCSAIVILLDILSS
jgi:hypothetical protein